MIVDTKTKVLLKFGSLEGVCVDRSMLCCQLTKLCIMNERIQVTLTRTINSDDLVRSIYMYSHMTNYIIYM